MSQTILDSIIQYLDFKMNKASKVQTGYLQARDAEDELEKGMD